MKRNEITNQILELVSSQVESEFQITRDEILNPSRSRAPIARARQVIAYLLKTVFEANHAQIARAMSRERTTIRHAVKTIAEDMETFPVFGQRVKKVEKNVRAAAAVLSDADKQLEAAN